MKLGTRDVKAVTLGDRSVSRVMLGDRLVWPTEAPARASLTRTRSGLIFMDLFEDGDVSDWANSGARTHSLTTQAPRYGAGALRSSINTGETAGHWTYRDFTPHEGNFAAQYWARNSRGVTVYLSFVDDRAAAFADPLQLGMLTLFRSTPKNIQVGRQGASLLDIHTNWSDNTWHKLAHVVNTTSDQADTIVNDGLSVSHALYHPLAGVSSMLLGYGGSRVDTDIDNLVVTSDASLTVTGLPSGYSVVAFGWNGLHIEQAESGGTVVMNVIRLDWPLLKLEVRNALGRTMVSFDQPAGGDVYEYTDGLPVTGDRSEALLLTRDAAALTVNILPHKAVYDPTGHATYFAFNGPGRDLYVSRVDHANSDEVAAPVLVGAYPIDAENAHGSPTITIDASGYLHVTWGSHSNPHAYSRSTNPRDITAWTTTNLPGTGTYPDITARPGTNHLYVVDRAGGSGGVSTHGSSWPAHEYAGLHVSLDGGVTWQTKVPLVNTYRGSGSSDYYPMGSTWHDDRLHFAWLVLESAWGHGGEPAARRNLYHAIYDPADGHVYTADGADLGAAPITWDDHPACLVIPGELLTNGSLVVDDDGIYLTANVGNALESYVHTAVWDGSAWTVTNTSVRQVNGFSQAFITRDGGSLLLYTAERDVAGGAGESVLNLYTSSDGGASWVFARTVLETPREAGIDRVVPLEGGGPFVAIAQADLVLYAELHKGLNSGSTAEAVPLFAVKKP